MKKVSVVLVLVLLPALALAATTGQRQVTVTAQGHIEAYPDMATLTATVEKTAPTVAQANAQVDKVSDQAIAAARSAGIAHGDISASRIRVQPHYEWREQKRVLVGQQVIRSIEVKLRDLDDYGKLVQALIAAGVTELGNANFDFSNRDELERRALTEAAAAAKRKAETIARAFGAHLGPVSKVTASAMQPAPIYRAAALKAAASGGGNFVIGRERIDATITAEFPLTN